MTELAPETTVSQILNHPFFSGIDPALVHAMAAKAEERSYHVDELLAHAGRPAEEFFLVLEGKVSLELAPSGPPGIEVGAVGPGEILGWSWLVPPFRWRFDARATKPTRAIAVDAPAARYVLAAHPAFGYHFLMKLVPVIAGRLENTRRQLVEAHGR